MKKLIFAVALFLATSSMLTSCYTYTSTVGKGSQTGQTVTKKNHYLVYGLAAISTSDSKQMAGGATDYEVTVTHTFIDGLIAGLTSGLYTPTTTVVKK
jgi:predicted small secreted protein